MYYVLLAIIAILLFIMRKRIIGGIVGVISIVLVIGLTIFLFDFFWLGQNSKGEDRDIRNFEPTQSVVKEFDDTIKDPVKKAQDIGQSAQEMGVNVNETLKETGSALDDRLGIQKDSSNNNLWGSSKEEEGDNETEHESKETDKGFLDKLVNNKTDKEESGETESQNTNQNKNKLSFDQLNRAESAWGVTQEDGKFIKSASPFNTGEFSNGNITIIVEKDGVSLK